MICEVTRRQLLSADRPDRPPPAVRPHLAECPSCRDWLRNLTEVEARIPLLPVPPSDDAKGRLLKQLREPPLVHESLRVVAPELPFTPPKERALRKAAVAVALAAAVVLFAVGLSFWPRHPNAPQEVALTERERKPADVAQSMREVRDQRLAKAQTPRSKVGVLASFADDLLRDARNPDALPPADWLEQVAKLYEETVQDELLKQARTLAPDDRRKLLPGLANELGRTESEFQRLAAGASEASANHLRRIAAAARESDRQLRQLAAEANA
jgi:hypothetical protein